MPEMRLRQPGLTYSACGAFTIKKERIKNLKETGDSRYICQNKLDKARFQHGMAYEDFKDLSRRTAADKVLRDKTFNIPNNPKYDGYQGGLATMAYKFLDEKTSATGANKFAGSGIKNENISNKELAEDLQKPIVRKLNKSKEHSPFIENIWGAYLADMQLISKSNKASHFLLCVIDIFSKYAWVIPLKEKKGITITDAFQKVLKGSNCKKQNMDR